MEKLHIYKRIAVGTLFICTYKAEEDENEWVRISKEIHQFMGIPQGTKIYDVFRDIIDCKRKGITWVAEDSFQYGNVGRNPIITIDSQEAQVIADAVEKGCGRRIAHDIVNHYRKTNHLPSLTEAAVYSCILRMRPPLVRSIGFRPQASKEDENSVGSIARCLFSLQTTIIRLGIPDADRLLAEYMTWKNLEDVPIYLQFLVEEFISIYDLIMWDETHRQCAAGTGDGESLAVTSSRTYISQFPRDEIGKLDFENGVYSTLNISQVKVKFANEARFSFGCTVNNTIDPVTGEETKIGLRCNIFSYTGKLMVTIKRYEKEKQTCIDHVRKLPSGGEWRHKPEGTADKVYKDDPADKVKGLGGTSKKHLCAEGIKTIEDLLLLGEEEIAELAQRLQQRTDRIPEEKIQEWKEKAQMLCEMQGDVPQSRPQEIDYRTFPNPFLARYGEDNWEEELKKYGDMKDYCDVRDLVWHMVRECVRLDKRYFWHDALSQLTDKNTKEWMKINSINFRGADRPIYDFWFRPVKNLLHDQPVSSHYYDRQPGNFPTANA